MRQSKRGGNKKNCNTYGEDFVVDRVALDDITVSVVGLNEIMASHDSDLVDDTETDKIEDQ